ncbi:FAD-dependent 5-carboxymethylaminomethyl-2-thiouridine(34) oxidoreductase MnmC [Alphaproteobacteria bacterium]|nr:FAD-dependent 5-carboxymethylaminomethyl-2-thiouridine(34) oxidoreductase MnmC [Alphaproteobacteria bacterium]
MKNNLKKAQLSVSPKFGVYSKLYGDIFFDKTDAIKEREHVYIKTNKLLTRFKKKTNFTIAELGFGTGLNFLLTWQLWLQVKKSNSILTYISFESAPLSRIELLRVHGLFKNLTHLSKIFLKKLPSLYQGTHRIYLELGNINLILIYDDFLSLTNFNFKADTWFLDGFSPKKNPHAWSDEIFEKVYKCTNFNGSLSTFTVAGDIRRGLLKNNFNVFKTKGVGKKNEILYALKKQKDNIIKFKSTTLNSIEPVAVIGSGISGASLVYSLRKRNIKCFLIDKASQLGNGASGNKVALQMPKLTLDESPYGLLSLEAFSYSRKLAWELNSVPRSNGLILLPSREREIVKFKELLNNNWPLELLDKNSSKLQILEKINYLYMRSSGIIDNKKFIKKLVGNVEFISKFKVKNIEIKKGGYKNIIDIHGNKLLAKTVIWANGYEMLDMNTKIPVTPVSGQVTYVEKTHLSSELKVNFSYGHFISQAYKGYHQIGASFDKSNNLKYREIDQLNNLNSIPFFLKKVFNNNNLLDHKYRVAVRASTKDRMPFLGTLNSITGKKEKNIFILGGMGAWGFVYAPFYAEILVKKMLNEPIIVSEKIKKLLSVDRLI